MVITIGVYNDDGLSTSPSFTQPTLTSLTATSIFCKIFPIKCCSSKQSKLTLDPLFYNSGDTELRDLIGPAIVLNSLNCNGFIFSYSVNNSA